MPLLGEGPWQPSACTGVYYCMQLYLVTAGGQGTQCCCQSFLLEKPLLFKMFFDSNLCAAADLTPVVHQWADLMTDI